MRTCEFDGVFAVEPRSHPWTDAVSSAESRYYDFKATPARIRTSLEDFVPWTRYGAVDEFYSLLEWLNGPRSPFESNDCAFTPPHENDSPSVAAALACSGRVMVLYRELPLNVSRADLERLANALHHALGALERELERGIIGTTLVPVRYVTLPPDAQLGHELMVSFWAWGDTEAELMENLARVVKSLFSALREVAADYGTAGG